MIKELFAAVMTCCLLALMAAAPAQAQMPGTEVRATIPFDFIVRGRTLPAGDYGIRRINDSPEGLLIENLTRKMNVVFETEPGQSRKQIKRGELLFHRYGDTYFLCEIWAAGDETGRELGTSRAERVVRREFARNNQAEPETVALALY